MAALAAPLIRRESGAKVIALKVKSGTAIYAGGLVSIDTTGFAIPYAGAAGERLVGRALPSPSGDSTNLGASSTTGDSGGTIYIMVNAEPETWIQQTVTGVAAATDVGKIVYASDDNVLTLTRPARGQPVGVVTRWYSSTTCDVTTLSMGERFAASLSGNGSDAKMVLATAFAGMVSADFQILQPPYRCTIRSITATVLNAFTTGASGSYTLQPKINTTLVTGGVVTINTTGGTGGTAGDVCAGTAITALNTLGESDTLKLTGTLTSTFTAGSCIVNMIFDRVIGA